MKAQWGNHQAPVNSPSDLDAVVEAVRKSGTPTMVFLEAENARTFVFGVGLPDSVVTFVEPDGTSFHALGDASRSGFLVFLCRDTLDEFIAARAITEPEALVAARQFLTTRARPQGVQWEPDW